MHARPPCGRGGRSLRHGRSPRCAHDPHARTPARTGRSPRADVSPRSGRSPCAAARGGRRTVGVAAGRLPGAADAADRHGRRRRRAWTDGRSSRRAETPAALAPFATRRRGTGRPSPPRSKTATRRPGGRSSPSVAPKLRSCARRPPGRSPPYADGRRQTDGRSPDVRRRAEAAGLRPIAGRACSRPAFAPRGGHAPDGLRMPGARPGGAVGAVALRARAVTADRDRRRCAPCDPARFITAARAGAGAHPLSEGFMRPARGLSPGADRGRPGSVLLRRQG